MAVAHQEVSPRRPTSCGDLYANDRNACCVTWTLPRCADKAANSPQPSASSSMLSLQDQPLKGLKQVFRSLILKMHIPLLQLSETDYLAAKNYGLSNGKRFTNSQSWFLFTVRKQTASLDWRAFRTRMQSTARSTAAAEQFILVVGRNKTAQPADQSSTTVSISLLYKAPEF